MASFCVGNRRLSTGAIAGKKAISRSFPLILAQLSRGMERLVGVNGAGLGGFWADFGGTGRHLSGFERVALAMFERVNGMTRGLGGGLDLGCR